MNVLGIETSCDETAAAVVRDGRIVLSNVVFSQVALHRPYGGVVPEVASRSHVETLPGVIAQAVFDAGCGWDGLDAIAVTYGPGLATSLMVGLNAAKGLALRLGKPLIAINHIEGHIYSVFLGENAPREADICPYVSLVVSGGHTSLIRVSKPGILELLGQTLDDAAGEAFDKGAKLMNLGFPGGPAIDRAARVGNRAAVKFPRSRHKSDRMLPIKLDLDLCFSFSGLKTALLYHIRDNPLPPAAASAESTPGPVADLAASYQEAIVNMLADRCDRALRGEKCLAIGGGVSLNRRLRERLAETAASRGARFLAAEPKYCADNAAMIAGLAGAGRGIAGDEAMALDVDPSLPHAVRDWQASLPVAEHVHKGAKNSTKTLTGDAPIA